MPYRQNPEDFFRSNFGKMVSLAQREIQSVQEEVVDNPAPSNPAAPYHPSQRFAIREDNSWKVLLVIGFVVIGIAILAYLAFLKSIDNKPRRSSRNYES